MTTFANLSAESKDIIFNLFPKLRGRSIISDTDKQLMVSLYATMPFAKAEVLEILGRYKVNLAEFLTSEEIVVLQNEYSAVIPFCFQRTDLDRNAIVHGIDGVLHLPVSLVELCMEMAEDTANKSVYLPYSGDGSFALYCEGASVKGFEVSEDSWAISQILTSIFPVSQDINLVHSSGEFAESQDSAELYDLVFTFPPG